MPSTRALASFSADYWGCPVRSSCSHPGPSPRGYTNKLQVLLLPSWAPLRSLYRFVPTFSPGSLHCTSQCSQVQSLPSDCVEMGRCKRNGVQWFYAQTSTQSPSCQHHASPLSSVIPGAFQFWVAWGVLEMLTHCYKYPFCRSLVCACLCCCQETLLYFSSVRNLLKSLVCSFTYVFFFFSSLWFNHLCFSFPSFCRVSGGRGGEHK